jgi:hypothetical protein
MIQALSLNYELICKGESKKEGYRVRTRRKHNRKKESGRALILEEKSRPAKASEHLSRMRALNGDAQVAEPALVHEQLRLGG